MSQQVYLNTNSLIKLQQMVSDEIEATENVIDQYETAAYPVDSLNFDLNTLLDINHALKHAKNSIGK